MVAIMAEVCGAQLNVLRPERLTECFHVDRLVILAQQPAELGGLQHIDHLAVVDVIGAVSVKLYGNSAKDQMHIQRFLSANCFGDIDIPTRELLTLSMLVALGGCDPQVKGHVAANLHVGNDRALLIDVVTQLLPYIGYPRTLNGLRAIDEGAPEKEAR